MKFSQGMAVSVSAALLSLVAACGTGPVQKTPVQATLPSTSPLSDSPKNVIFFLGDGMGINTLTAARIYSVGEEGSLTIDTLPETAFVKTYSNNAQVTDSAPSMSAYMTGHKMNNDVLSMSSDTLAVEPLKDEHGNLLKNNCGSANGKPVPTLIELAKTRGWSTGVVTTTRVTHATPAATYAHICYRDLENDIAAAMVPGGAGYNAALGQQGLDVVLGGGTQFFLPYEKNKGSKRTDGRNLIDEMKANSYSFVSNAAEFRALDGRKTKKLLGLFTSSHMSYDIDRDLAKEPSLAEMTTKAMDVLAQNPQGYFLMVEGGRIDHALHETNAKKALQDTVAFDHAIHAAIQKARQTDPELKNTLIVVTADHDHTIVLNGYAQRTGKTTATEPGVLGFVKDVASGKPTLDLDKAPYTIIGFGNGEKRTKNRADLTGLSVADVVDKNYHQEAAIQVAPGSETHGGTDVFLGAIGRGAEHFLGTIENTAVFKLIKQVTGL